MMKSAGASIKITTWVKKHMKAASIGTAKRTKTINGSSFVLDLASKGYQTYFLFSNELRQEKISTLNQSLTVHQFNDNFIDET